MENGGVKNIVLIALVVVLSFFVGSLSVDGMKNTITPIVIIVGVFFMLYLGKNSKYLIYYLPPAVGLVKIGIPNALLTTSLCIGVFVYWILMSMMGYARLRWARHIGLDLQVLLMFLYMCVSYYRNPVSIDVLGIELDSLGGQDYLYCVLGTLSYIAVSYIPFTAEELYKLMRNLVWYSLFCSGLQIVIALLTGKHGGDGDELMENAQTSRFTLFMDFGRRCSILIYALYPLGKLVMRPTLLAALLLSAAAVCISGWRSALITYVLSITCVAFFKRELTVYCLIGGSVYAGLLFLSSEHAFDGLPYGIQRSLCAVPGIHVSEEVEKTATSSSDWRVEMWEWAMDPRTHLIRDYVWGDGPGHSRADMERRSVAIMRGTLTVGDNKDFARLGVWHSGWVTLISFYGYVGFGIMGFFHLFYSVMLLLMCLKYRRTSYYAYFVVYAGSRLPSFAMFYLSTGSAMMLFATLPTVAFIKQLYVKADELGLKTDFFKTDPYVPLMIQDINQEEVKATGREVNA